MFQGAFGKVLQAEALGLRQPGLVSVVAVKMLKEGEDQKIKTYNALCVCPDGGGDDFDAVKERLESLKESLSEPT